MLEVVLAFAGFGISVGYFAWAGFTAHRVAAGNEKAHAWIMGLFVVVYLLAWPALFYALG